MQTMCKKDIKRKPMKKTKRTYTKRAKQTASIPSEKFLIKTESLEPSFDPTSDTLRAKQAADQLKDIIENSEQGKYIVRINNQSEHLKFEAWQTIAQYYHCSVDTSFKEPKYVEYGGASGFEAYAQVISHKTGFKIGGASAICMNDEPNWRNKPKFQLQSMAQTRAGAKALRDIFASVVVLAGYNATPAEEMDGIDNRSRNFIKPSLDIVKSRIYMDEDNIIHERIDNDEDTREKTPVFSITQEQKLMIIKLMAQKGKNQNDMIKPLARFKKVAIKDLTTEQAGSLIIAMQSLPDRQEEIVDADQAEAEIEQMRFEK